MQVKYSLHILHITDTLHIMNEVLYIFNEVYYIYFITYHYICGDIQNRQSKICLQFHLNISILGVKCWNIRASQAQKRINTRSTLHGSAIADTQY